MNMGLLCKCRVQLFVVEVEGIAGDGGIEATVEFGFGRLEGFYGIWEAEGGFQSFLCFFGGKEFLPGFYLDGEGVEGRFIEELCKMVHTSITIAYYY